MTRQLAFRLLTMAVSTILALGCAEAIFRWHVHRRFLIKFPKSTGDLVVVPGPQVFAYKPHVSGLAPGGLDSTHKFQYRTNAQGLRDRDRSAKQPGTKRVLVIGDSYTWGYAVAEEEAYPQVAERLLRERGRADIEVINGGVPDYNSRQERQLLAQLLPIYQPDAVFLAYVMNDAEPPTAVPVPPDQVFRHANSWVLAEAADLLNRHTFKRRALSSAKDNHVGNYLEGFEAGSVKWRESREAIRQMRDLSAAVGASFSMLILPDVTQELDDRYGWRTIHSAVSRWGRELDIPTYDLLDLVRGRDHQTLLVPWDGHPNAQAHAEFANFLVTKILAKLGPSSGT